MEQFCLERSLAVHRPFGSEPPSATGRQVPTLPVSLHVMQRPEVESSLHAVSQHTPSVQCPLTHWLPVVHATPIGLRPQVLLLHVVGGTQSLSWVQLVRQAVPLHVKVPQVISFGVTHFPAPSHAEAGVSLDEEEQSAAPQFLPLSKYAQAPLLQAPVVWQVDCVLTLHLPCGSGEPSATELHVPSELDRLQASHDTSQALLQHTPWAQKFESQSAATLHIAPGGLFPHELLTQNLPETQSLSVVQIVVQALPLQMYGLQLIDSGDSHCPEALHVEGGV